MFQQLKNIDTAFQHVRLFSFLLMVASTTISCYAVYKSNQLVLQAQDRIYILFNGKVLEALSAERKNNILVELRDHVKTFHHYFFTLDPDEKTIMATITRALYMADISAKQQYDNLKENRYYSNIISGNISQTIEPDSVTVDVNQEPYYFRYYAKQRIIRSTTIVIRSLVTEGYLRKVAQTDNNPHGFLIERWNTVENKDINIYNR